MKAAIYCRLSEEDRNKKTEADDSESIQNQKSLLVAFTIKQNWEIFNIYSDEDYTGSDRLRPEFNRLLADAEKRKFDIVLCKSQSRFTRELELVEKYIHSKFLEWNIRFISIVDNADTAVEGNKKSRQIHGLINEWYLEDISQNVKSVLTNKRKNGQHIGSTAPFGYKKDPEKKGHLIINEPAAKIVKMIFELYASGLGKTAISRKLNEMEILSPLKYKKLTESNSSFLKYLIWKPSVVGYILKNQVYIGDMVQGRHASVSYKSKKTCSVKKENWIIVENMHEPIINRALWDKTQFLLEQQAKPFKSGEIGIFAKKVKCMQCGSMLKSGRSGGKRYLNCKIKCFFPGTCEGAFIMLGSLEKLILREIHNLSKIYLKKKKSQNDANFKMKREVIVTQIKKLEAEIFEFNEIEKQLYIDKLKNVISDEQFVNFSKDFAAKRKKTKLMIENSNLKIVEIDKKLSSNERISILIEKYQNIEKLDRNVIETLIDCILVEKRKIGEKFPKIEIQWNF